MLKKRKISVFGNTLVEKDSLPLRILPKLKKKFPDIEFVIEDPTEILDLPQNEWWILDSAEGIEEVTVIGDISKLEISKRMTVHDYDLTFDLKLLSKLKRLPKIKIIAIPSYYSESKAFEEVSIQLRTVLALQGLSL